MENNVPDPELSEPDEPSPEAAVTATKPEAAAPPEAPRFAVTLTIEIEQVLVPIERLQALREGAVVPVAAESGAIPVRVMANGRPIARGSLVSVGERYGVLIGEDPLEV
jgi:flagellar motor switch protein FliN